jgi:hypothetical protein
VKEHCKVADLVEAERGSTGGGIGGVGGKRCKHCEAPSSIWAEVTSYIHFSKLLYKEHRRSTSILLRLPSLLASFGIYDLALMMSTNAGFKLAPPTRKPSISFSFASSLQFFSLTLPP